MDISGIMGMIRKAVAGSADPSRHFISAIIVAAGSSARMGAALGVTKQHAPLLGKPVLARSMAIFDAAPFISEIIIAARPDEVELCESYAAKYGFTKPIRVVAGGATRQESVLCAFKVISDNSEYVMIHDAARCLLTADRLQKVAEAGVIDGAAIAVSLVNDTVKQTDGSGYITATHDRSALRCAQTPQMFRTEMYRAAAYYALSDGFEGTDDSSLVERLGFSVRTVDCGWENIKLTTAVDFDIARAILISRGECPESTGENR